jgi:O-antigen/teichoic acid export membrane protein
MDRTDNFVCLFGGAETGMMHVAKIRSAIAKPGALAFADQALVSAGNFFSLLLVARHVAAEKFGLFSLAMMSLLFLANLHRAAFTQPMNILGAAESLPCVTVRMLALLRAQLLAIPLAALLLAVLALHFFPQMALLLGAICYITGFYLQEMSRRYWYTLHRVERAIASDIISYGGQLAALAVLAASGRLDGAIALTTMGAASFAAFLFDLWRMESMSAARRHELRSLRLLVVQHWPLSRWLLLTVLAMWGGSQLYPFLLATLGPVAVASYVACRNLLNAIGVMIQSVGNYLPVRAAALLQRRGKTALRNHLLRTLVQAALFGLAFVLLVVLAAEPLMHLAYGGRYDSAVPLLRMLALATLFTLLGAVLGAYSLAMEDSRASFLANLGATCVALSAGAWLIHTKGLHGAAIAATLSTATSMTLQAMLVWRRFNSLSDTRRSHA